MPGVEYGLQLGVWRIAARLFWHYTLIAYLMPNNGHTMKRKERKPMSSLDLLPLFLPAATIGAAIGAQSIGRAAKRAAHYRKRGGLRFVTIGRLCLSWSVKRKGA
jgi:hypothetical protein